jgi:hypothetical protein
MSRAAIIAGAPAQRPATVTVTVTVASPRFSR